MLVVHAVLVLDTAAAAQTIIVERSITGTAELPDEDSLRGRGPPLPVSNALVVVTRDDSVSIGYSETTESPGVYKAVMDWSAPFVIAGREYVLTITTMDGRVVRGRTRVPFPPAVTGLPADGASFNRDTDTLRLSWTPPALTKDIFVQVRPRDTNRRLTLLLFTDSTTVRLPGATPLPADGDVPPMVWIPGTRQTVTVSSMDTAFFNFFRTGNDPFTGAGFINSLTGGMGVFGAMAPVNRTVDVVAEVNHPYEGRYRLQGTVVGETLDAEVRLFVTRLGEDPVLVSGLVAPQPGTLLASAEISGNVFQGDELHAVLTAEDPAGGSRQLRHFMQGNFVPGGISQGSFASDGVQTGTWTLARLP